MPFLPKNRCVSIAKYVFILRYLFLDEQLVIVIEDLLMAGADTSSNAIGES